MAVALRMDLRQPVPLRCTSEFLYGDVRRRARRGAAGAGFTLALVVAAGLWLARQDTGFQPAAPAAVEPVAANEEATRPLAEEFPLIPDSPAPAPRAVAEFAPPAALLHPLTEPPAPIESPPPPGPEATPSAAVVPQPPPAPQAAAAKVPSPPASTVSPREPVKTASSATVADSPKPASPAPPTGAASKVPANYILQLGTYRLEESARADQEHFRTLGIDTIILRRGAYLVLRLPPFDTREEAEREESRLRQRGIIPLFIPPTDSEE